MVLIQQTVEQPLFRCASHLAEFQWPNLPQARVQGHSIHLDYSRATTLYQRIAAHIIHWRQLYQALAVQVQH
jgi:hypothetical protein